MNYRINTYEHGFMIEKAVIAKKDTDNQKAGDLRWQAFKYPKDLKDALVLLLELCTRDNASNHELDGIQGVQAALEQAQDDVRCIALDFEERRAYAQDSVA